MFGYPSLMTRIAVGKIVGLIIGVAGFFYLQFQHPDGGLLFRWGVLFWYVTMGAIIGLFGVLTYHPVLKMPLPWWFGSILMGGWLNFVLVFFAYDALQAVLVALMGADSGLTSPFWFVLEGAVIGFVIGAFATWFGGSGVKTVQEGHGQGSMM